MNRAQRDGAALQRALARVFCPRQSAVKHDE